MADRRLRRLRRRLKGLGITLPTYVSEAALTEALRNHTSKSSENQVAYARDLGLRGDLENMSADQLTELINIMIVWLCEEIMKDNPSLKEGNTILLEGKKYRILRIALVKMGGREYWQAVMRQVYDSGKKASQKTTRSILLLAGASLVEDSQSA